MQERRVLQSAKLEKWGHLSFLASHRELQDLKFALMGFSLVSAHYAPFLPLRIVIYIYGILYGKYVHFISQGFVYKEIVLNLRRYLEFGILNCVETVKNSGDF